MRRGQFIAGLGVASAYAAVSPLAHAQQGPRVRRLAILSIQAEPLQTNTYYPVLRNELAKLGWVEGRNLQADVRFGADVDRMRANAAELVGLAPDVMRRSGKQERQVQSQDYGHPRKLRPKSKYHASGSIATAQSPERGRGAAMTRAALQAHALLV